MQQLRTAYATQLCSPFLNQHEVTRLKNYNARFRAEILSQNKSTPL